MEDGEGEPTRGSRGVVFESNEWLADQIAGRVPGILEVQQALSDGLWPFTNAVIAGADQTDPVEAARSRIASQATNDFLDLFYESFSGFGRPAARTARTLYEHAVNMRWVTANPAEAEAYCDHAAIGELLDLELATTSEDQFTGKTRKRVRHWRRTLERRIRPAADDAISRHGPWFRRTWTRTQFRERADSSGLGHDYDAYRLLSAVIHGSAGGDFGHRQRIGERAVVRTGPAISICPFALATGLRHYRTVVDDVALVLGPNPTAILVDALDQIAALLPAHEAASYSTDADLWPSDAPRTVMLLSIQPDGTETWLLLHGELPKTIIAEPVGLDAAYQQRIRDNVAAIEAANPGRTKPLIIAVAGITGSPKPGARWQPASENLRQRAPWEEGIEYRAQQVTEPRWDPSLHG